MLRHLFLKSRSPCQELRSAFGEGILLYMRWPRAAALNPRSGHRAHRFQRLPVICISPLYDYEDLYRKKQNSASENRFGNIRPLKAALPELKYVLGSDPVSLESSG